jgi:hypothetical protein
MYLLMFSSSVLLETLRNSSSCQPVFAVSALFFKYKEDTYTYTYMFVWTVRGSNPGDIHVCLCGRSGDRIPGIYIYVCVDGPGIESRGYTYVFVWTVRGSNPGDIHICLCGRSGDRSPGGGRDFPHLSRPSLGRIQPPVQWVDCV